MTMHVPYPPKERDDYMLLKHEFAKILKRNEELERKSNDDETYIAVLERLLTEHGVDLPRSFH